MNCRVTDSLNSGPIVDDYYITRLTKNLSHLEVQSKGLHDAISSSNKHPNLGRADLEVSPGLQNTRHIDKFISAWMSQIKSVLPVDAER